MLFLLLALFAQQAEVPPPDMPVTAERRAEIVAKTAQKIEEEYVDPDKGKAIAAAVRNASFNQESALALVRAVNEILKTSGDEHLRFGYDASPGADDSAEEALIPFGVQRLDGNVGLLTVKEFQDPTLAGDALMQAMKELASTKAMIIDMRGCRGGSAQMVMLTVSCFMPPEPVLVSTVYFRPTNSTRQYWTLPYLPVPRYVNKPVYILTSSRVFSAGEGFCEHMQRLRHAIITGETTRGGAHMARWENVDPNFGVSVPVARHMEHDWEGVGIKPDVAVPAADALKTALALASK